MNHPESRRPFISRRNFLAVSAAIPAALMAPSLKENVFAQESAAAPAGGAAKKYPIGLELYSVRGEWTRDFPNMLRNVAKIGYEVVEFYSPYYAWTIPHAKEVKTMMDDLNLRCYSTHNGTTSFGDGIAKAIELNQILGAKYIILASTNVRGVDGWKKLCEQLTTVTEQMKPHGLVPGFHNHQTEWAKIDGELRIMDMLAANTPKEFILQFDVGTCMQAGADPIAWIKANPGRIKSVHLKDWAPGSDADQKGYRTLFGEGISPWKDIFAAVESVGGVEYYLMEQEGSRFPEFETAQKCLDTWKAMRKA